MAANENTPTKPAAAPASGDIDRLTGVLNHAAIEASVEAAVSAGAGGENIAIGYIGIDHFELLNETYGSLVTDHLLRDIATRIHENLRPHDTLGRVGRNEFMVVFRELASKFESFALSAKIRTAIAEPIRAGQSDERLSPGCGIAQYPANGKTVAELRTYAENGMRTLLVAMRNATVVEAQEKIDRARANVEAAQAALEEAHAAYEAAVALVAASEAAGASEQAPGADA